MTALRAMRAMRAMRGANATKRCTPGAAGQLSALALRLQLQLQAGKAGSVTLSVSAPHAMVNLSSLPLRMYDARLLTDYGHVAESSPHAYEAVPFSLSDLSAIGAGGGSDSARLGLGTTAASSLGGRLPNRDDLRRPRRRPRRRPPSCVPARPRWMWCPLTAPP